jgi:hypothetical protein
LRGELLLLLLLLEKLWILGEKLLLFGDIILTSYGIKTINKIEGVFISIGDDFSERDKNI